MKYLFEFPDIKQFEAKHKDDCPYFKFFHWVAEKLGGIPEGKKMDNTRIYVLPADCRKLEKLVNDWAKKYHNRAKSRFSVQCHHFNYSPAELKDKKSGVYLKGEFFI